MAKPEGKGAIVEDGVSELEKWFVRSWQRSSFPCAEDQAGNRGNPTQVSRGQRPRGCTL